MNGVSRFVHPANCTVLKNDDTTLEGIHSTGAMYVLSEHAKVPGFEPIYAQAQFSHFQKVPPALVIKPGVYLHQRETLIEYINNFDKHSPPPDIPLF